MKLSLIGLTGSFLSIVLSVILMFWNPYSSQEVSNYTMLVILIMLVIPACVGVVASIYKLRYLMGIALVWSLPMGVYLSIASIPSVFNLYAVVLLMYLASALMMRRGGVV
ncbi:hypothetical protein PCCS19_02120 [Paenibacillus sp. CCS19]|uniref:hypothetical protein n=1 Tax=Paenibacillus sp. CCS19 TaxID=3158387 RepID=UPI00256CCAAA|nr:hypothetical protein [Paenibacillus cellulosilyticus]GMK37159.1 hypothetical protein PCCS19_02120 [Paenibacillus cellulosilyticus]